ncbi:cell division protein FtsK, partial [Micromonospora sp. CPCC 205539]
MTTTIPTTADAVPVGPGLSMFDPIFIGIDEFGQPVYLDVI